MRYPKSLKKGDTIGFVAPSFGAFIEPYRSLFQNAILNFKALGYSADLGPNVFEGTGIGISSTPENCGRELTTYYCRKENQAVISVGGGEMMCETMEFTDFEKISASGPKWYMGYSDNTNFTFLLPTLCDTAAIYGPHAPTFGMEPWDESLKDAFLLLTGEKKCFTGYDSWEREEDPFNTDLLAPFNRTEETRYILSNWNGKPVKGRFLGGCVEVLGTLVGTSYDKVREFNARYQKDGVIWFLEACELNSVGVERALWQMREAGWFDTAKAFLIGRPGNFGDESFGLTQYEAVLREVRKLEKIFSEREGREVKIPVIMDADVGHLPPQIPIISGGYGTICVRGAVKEEGNDWTIGGKQFEITYEER